MSAARHTPGPWLVFKPKGKSSRGIGPSVELIVARATPSFYEGVHHAASNANLIAAAPDLLEALKRILQERSVCSSLKCQDKGHSLTCRFTQARAAIAKAEGL